MTAALLPARALVWLMGGFAILLAVQWQRLPLWLLAACLLLVIWRWLAQAGRVRLPGRILKGAVMLALITAYTASVGGRFTVETAGSFFVLAVALKWLETRTARDFYVLFFILCYLAAVNFLFQQGILWSLLNFFAILVLLIGLQVLNAPDLPHPLRSGGKRLAGLFLKTLPVVVLLFIFFPRLSPLWSVPLVSDQARTGISDTMSPGTISSLAQSSERAFRVTFPGEPPPHRERYWRALILDRYDGTEWTPSRDRPAEPAGKVMTEGGIGSLKDDEYDVLMEPTNRRWAFGLANSRAVSNNVERTGDGLFRFRRPADTAVQYRLARDGAPTGAPALSGRERDRYLRLPASGEARSRQLARRLDRAHDSDRALIRTLMQRFRNQPYYYTLQPPAMPDDPVDTLLFDAQRGFCAHYASATAFVLRAAGIPSRIVVGYQGGSPGADNEYLIVRQYDAHAWVEAWIPGAGWRRIDPTAAISPARIEQGLQEAVADEGSFLSGEWASPEKYHDIELVRWASLQIDRINYHWQRWVVGYQGQTQMDLMGRLPGNWSLTKLGYLSAGVVGAALLVAGIVTAWRQRTGRHRDPVQRLFHRWRRQLARRGVDSSHTDTPVQLADRASARFPEQSRLHQAFARTINNYYYGEASGSERRRLRWLLKRMKGAGRTPG
ncbi:transglutaminase [Tamilnaduibacter salinus]|uniref:Transglutaminase n=1 Tax=Tamilnaduibacter salinus TaxID=1484056 RepID=A0A2A2HZQ9_9GAMM|nr:transglutaminaseTgpA domain-containing protein [Tamilnaduibacter salinus]PAV24628.1 transglutaminase [Tamilnaduibacter salinus]